MKETERIGGPGQGRCMDQLALEFENNDGPQRGSAQQGLREI